MRSTPWPSTTPSRRWLRVARRLDVDALAWLTTVGRDGAPQPVPVWFLRDGDEILLYSKPGTPKLANIAARPRVSLHLDGDGRSRWGIASSSSAPARRTDDPPAHEVPATSRSTP